MYIHVHHAGHGSYLQINKVRTSHKLAPVSTVDSGQRTGGSERLDVAMGQCLYLEMRVRKLPSVS